jgi:hypothetical protein
LLVAHAREGAVETVAEPVRRERDDDEGERPGRPARGPVGESRHEHRREPDERQVIGRHPSWQARGDPDERVLLVRGEQAAVFADVGGHAQTS